MVKNKKSDKRFDSLFIEDADFGPLFTKSKTEQQKIKINNFLYSSQGVFNFYLFIQEPQGRYL